MLLICLVYFTHSTTRSIQNHPCKKASHSSADHKHAAPGATATALLPLQAQASPLCVSPQRLVSIAASVLRSASSSCVEEAEEYPP